jgi:hypothetical protein
VLGNAQVGHASGIFGVIGEPAFILQHEFQDVVKVAGHFGLLIPAAIMVAEECRGAAVKRLPCLVTYYVSGLVEAFQPVRKKMQRPWVTLHKNPNLTPDNTDDTDLHRSKIYTDQKAQVRPYFEFVSPSHPYSSVVRFVFVHFSVDNGANKW